jgi:hypothetical protein
VKRRAVAADVQYLWVEHGAGLHPTQGMVKNALTVGVDQFRGVKPKEGLASVSVHRACRGVGLDDAPGFQINKDQSVGDNLEGAAIQAGFALGRWRVRGIVHEAVLTPGSKAWG